MSKLSEETSDSLRAMKEKQTSLGVALSGVQAEVAMLMNPRTQTIFSQSKRWPDISKIDSQFEIYLPGEEAG